MMKANQVWIILKPEILIQPKLVILLEEELNKIGFTLKEKLAFNNWERVAYRLYENSDILIPEHLDLLLDAGKFIMGDKFNDFQVWTLNYGDYNTTKIELFEKLNEFKKVFRILVMSNGNSVKVEKSDNGYVRNYYRTYLHVADPKLKIINDEEEIISNTTVKYILFDGYGTLFNAGKENIWDISLKISQKYGIITQQVYSLWTKAYLEKEAEFDNKFATIIETNRLALKEVFESLKLPVNDVDNWVDILSKIWERPALIPSVKKLLSFIRKKRYKIGIISNIDEQTIVRAISYLHLEVDYVLSSERAGCYKPNTKIMEIALEELKINRNECIYIGNSTVDVKVANKSGIDVIHYNHERLKLDKDSNPTASVKKINELFNFDF